jgi:hypothetical protein
VTPCPRHFVVVVGSNHSIDLFQLRLVPTTATTMTFCLISTTSSAESDDDHNFFSYLDDSDDDYSDGDGEYF